VTWIETMNTPKSIIKARGDTYFKQGLITREEKDILNKIK